MSDPRTARHQHAPGNRWELVWSHRDELLEIARCRSSSAEDAEDIVQEAMIRAVEDPEVQYGRVGPWLRMATVRLCAGRHRQAARDSELATSLSAVAVEPVAVEQSACDRAEARWLAGRGAELLSARQAEALRLKSQDLDVGQVARHMGLSYRAAESLLARARRALREVLAATLTVGMAVWLFARRFPRTGVAQAAAATSTAATVAVMALALPAGFPDRPDGRRPGHSPGTTAPGVTPAAEPPDRRGTSDTSARAVSASASHHADRADGDSSGAVSDQPSKAYELPLAPAAVMEAIASHTPVRVPVRVPVPEPELPSESVPVPIPVPVPVPAPTAAPSLPQAATQAW